MKLKTISITIIVALFSLLFFNSSLPVYANDGEICSNPNVSAEIKSASGCSGEGDRLGSAIIGIVNAALSIIAIVAVIAIIIGGIQYMTSIGDPSKIKKAKDTILYAVIGLVIVILAALIVNFVIVNTT